MHYSRIDLHVFFLDIDECTEGTSNCSHLCLNTVGSYACQCLLGYQLDVHNHTCIGMCHYTVNSSPLLISITKHSFKAKTYKTINVIQCVIVNNLFFILFFYQQMLMNV